MQLQTMSCKPPQANLRASISSELAEIAYGILARRSFLYKSSAPQMSRCGAPPFKWPKFASLSWPCQPAVALGICLFDNDGSFLIVRDSAEGREIRRLAKRCVDKMALERRNGVYVLPTTIVAPERLTPQARSRTQPKQSWKSTAMEVDAVFPRQGR